MSSHELMPRLHGLLIGTAVGDALGLPAEGLSRRRIRRLYKGRWRHLRAIGKLWLGFPPKIPVEWRTGITDWPRSLPLLQTLADRLATTQATGSPTMPVRYFWPAIPLRNLLFLLIVLAHGFRRLLPPW